MTEKQQNILNHALKLFAEQGYASTSTAKIAKAAGVSEGLIFRHFTNKEGLLNAIMEQIKATIFEDFGPLFTEADPKKLLKSIIELPSTMKAEQQHVWRLIYSLKWQVDVYDSSMSAPLREALIGAFKALKYKKPDLEAELILVYLDGMAVATLLRKPNNLDKIIKTQLKKYNL